ncbi:MAG: hypothetical protein ABSE85_01650, partial [Candidatus Korobacteraceae bacterium]
HRRTQQSLLSALPKIKSVFTTEARGARRKSKDYITRRQKRRFVSGHEFTRAEPRATGDGFSRCEQIAGAKALLEQRF